MILAAAATVECGNGGEMVFDLVRRRPLKNSGQLKWGYVYANDG